MAQFHPYCKAHSNRRGGREGTRSKANTRDSQALPFPQSSSDTWNMISMDGEKKAEGEISPNQQDW